MLHADSILPAFNVHFNNNLQYMPARGKPKQPPNKVTKKFKPKKPRLTNEAGLGSFTFNTKNTSTPNPNQPNTELLVSASPVAHSHINQSPADQFLKKGSVRSVSKPIPTRTN